MIKFSKYQGTGNDFVLLDDRDGRYTHLSTEQIALLCDRRFGIGGDGLMRLQLADGYDFRMVYYNSDGREGSMCGNGGRCITAFAKHLGVIKDKAFFIAVDGEHHAFIDDTDQVNLQMSDVPDVIREGDHFLLNTGSPHFVKFIQHGITHEEVVAEGKHIRYSPRFKKDGINVNFVEPIDEHTIRVSTYERGVEDETYSCGTGVTAAAICFYLQHLVVADREDQDASFSETVNIIAKGGQLQVRLSHSDEAFTNIWLSGPARLVFDGVFSF